MSLDGPGLGITLLHARPYDAPARGKMERFWRRMREEALSHIGQVASLAEVELKLRDWLARYYQGAPHAGILGRTPAARYAEGEKVRVTEDELRAALTLRVRCRVRRDTTISVDGIVYEVPLGYLAGQNHHRSHEVEDTDLWLPASKVALIDDIEEALNDRQSVLLLGEPGVGKTCVLRALRRRLPQAGFRLTYCRNATLGRRDFYRHLCHTLGLHPTSVAANLFLAVETHVQELRRDRVHPVFLLDEAHLLQPDMLGHLHILMNYEWDAKALLSLVLIGLPELEANLSRRAHRSLLTRIHHRFLIAPATIEDTAEYVRFRLAAAGSDRSIFPDDALAALHELSQGALREIDRLATAALRDAARRKKKLVDHDVVTRVAEALLRFD